MKWFLYDNIEEAEIDIEKINSAYAQKLKATNKVGQYTKIKKSNNNKGYAIIADAFTSTIILNKTEQEKLPEGFINSEIEN